MIGPLTSSDWHYLCSRFQMKTRRRFLFIFVSITLGMMLTAASSRAADAIKPLYALCGAYGPELVALKKEFGVSEAAGWTRSTTKGLEYWRGQVGGKDVVIFRTGVSLVNAAYQLQLGLDRFPITHVLFAGVAGGTDPSLAIGDVVIPEAWAYHGEAVYVNPDPDGHYLRPSFPATERENFGMMFPMSTGVNRDSEEKVSRMELFPADPQLLAAARRALPKIPSMQTSGRRVSVSVGGNGVSAGVFLDNATYREWVFKTWGARCTDMESSALAHVAYANQIPILIIRGLSDLAGAQHGPNPLATNELPVAEIAARVLHRVLDEL